jgi:hypothetical protein
MLASGHSEGFAIAGNALPTLPQAFGEAGDALPSVSDRFRKSESAPGRVPEAFAAAESTVPTFSDGFHDAGSTSSTLFERVHGAESTLPRLPEAFFGRQHASPRLDDPFFGARNGGEVSTTRFSRREMPCRDSGACSARGKTRREDRQPVFSAGERIGKTRGRVLRAAKSIENTRQRVSAAEVGKCGGKTRYLRPIVGLAPPASARGRSDARIWARSTRIRAAKVRFEARRPRFRVPDASKDLASALLLSANASRAMEAVEWSAEDSHKPSLLALRPDGRRANRHDFSRRKSAGGLGPQRLGK